MKKIIKKNNCRACKSYNLKKILKYNDSPIGDDYRMYAHNHEKYPIEVYLCKSCGLTQLLHVISPKILYSNYIYKTQDSPGLTEHFIDFARKVSKKLNIKKKAKF
ncbi:class I SAM-dependent methyltransferase [Candidatus Pelagibacter sp. Uisw_106]|uniref:class I SAM-dependent methyltransferase n=1 Tax=Candidatus Pelagibacter sp. Uisw_106 TaxID=3230984 RepID=UPI0039E7D783